MLVIKLLVFLAGLFRPRITNVKTAPPNPSNMEQAGALVPSAAVVSAVAALSANAAPAFGNWSQTLIASSLSAATIFAGQLVGGIIRRFAPTAAFTDCTDTATNIVNAIPGAVPLQTFPVIIANLGSGANAVAMTLAGGTGVTIAGTATIAANSFRLYLGQVTGSAAVTLTNCFQWTANPVGAVTTGL